RLVVARGVGGEAAPQPGAERKARGGGDRRRLAAEEHHRGQHERAGDIDEERGPGERGAEEPRRRQGDEVAQPGADRAGRADEEEAEHREGTILATMPPVDEDDSIGPSTQPDSGAPTDVISAAGVEARLYQRFRLVVAGGPDVGTSFTSTGERAIVGTHGAADLRLFDRTVSRFHCELSLQGGRAVVRDLGSRNGT